MSKKACNKTKYYTNSDSTDTSESSIGDTNTLDDFSVSSTDSTVNSTNTSDDFSESDSDDIEKEMIARAKKNLSTYDRSDIRNIIFKDINDNYAHGNFGALKVVIMKKNGFINASKLCMQCNKNYAKWPKNKFSKEIIDIVKKRNKITDITIKVKNGANEIKGTYVHPKLITHIASWCSADFAYKVLDIVEEYVVKEAHIQISKIIKEKDDEIDRLEKTIKLMRKDSRSAFSDIKKNTRKIINQNNDISKKTDNILKKTDIIIKKTDNMIKKTDNMLATSKNSNLSKKKRT